MEVDFFDFLSLKHSFPLPRIWQKQNRQIALLAAKQFKTYQEEENF